MMPVAGEAGVAVAAHAAVLPAAPHPASRRASGRMSSSGRVSVDPEQHNQLWYVRAPDKPGVSVFSEGDRSVYVGGIGILDKCLELHRSSHSWLSTLACRMARIKTGRPASKSNRSASSAMHVYDTDDAFRGAFA